MTHPGATETWAALAAAQHLAAVAEAKNAIALWAVLARQPLTGDVADLLDLALRADEAMSSAEHTTRDAFDNFFIAMIRPQRNDAGWRGQSSPRLEEVAGQVWEAYRLVRVPDPGAALRAISEAKSALAELDSSVRVQ